MSYYEDDIFDIMNEKEQGFHEDCCCCMSDVKSEIEEFFESSDSGNNSPINKNKIIENKINNENKKSENKTKDNKNEEINTDKINIKSVDEEIQINKKESIHSEFFFEKDNSKKYL